MATNQEAQTLEESLNKTDLGHVINENKNIIMIIGAIFVAAVIGYSIFDQVNTSKRFEQLDRIFTVEKDVFKPFMAEKTKTAEFKISLGNINNELIAEPNLVPPFLEALNKLSIAGEIDANVLSIASKWYVRMNKTNFLTTLFAIRLAAINEDAKDIDASIKLLEGLVGKKDNLLKDKIHFELGRLYLAQGNMDTAKERFEYIFENHKDSEFAKLAKILLSGI